MIQLGKYAIGKTVGMEPYTCAQSMVGDLDFSRPWKVTPDTTLHERYERCNRAFRDMEARLQRLWTSNAASDYGDKTVVRGY
jgi:hypothetical protein